MLVFQMITSVGKEGNECIAIPMIDR